jgi:hypothetical protein
MTSLKVPKAELARELGVRVGQLRTWRLEFEKEVVTGIAKPDLWGTLGRRWAPQPGANRDRRRERVSLAS